MKPPRFFCENCGAEVSRDTKNCPHCGRYFASVRCPACGFTGAEGLFKDGCPVCGYSAPGGQTKNSETRPEKKDTRIAAGALPAWVYVLSLLALIAVAVVLYFAVR
jgi:uncharacterized membrane protein YvbJ